MTGLCSRCGTRVDLDPDGNVGRHKAPRARRYCVGGGALPRKGSVEPPPVGGAITDDPLLGRRVRLLCCADQFTQVEPGTEGRVRLVDGIGTVHVDWDNGSRLGLIRDAGDEWEVID